MVGLATAIDEPSGDGIPSMVPPRDDPPHARVATGVMATPDRPLPISTARAADEAPSASVIRPATIDSPIPLRRPRRVGAGPPDAVTAAPVLVRIGRIEVRGALAPSQRQPPSPRPPTPPGFAAYERVRTYRSWPR
jgi:hypothetical protein